MKYDNHQSQGINNSCDTQKKHISWDGSQRSISTQRHKEHNADSTMITFK